MAEGKERYAIVRVDNNCPFYTELVTTKCWIYKNDKSCIGFKCKIKKTYGDTKEQMIRKVAQARYRQELKLWWKLFKQEGIKLEATYERCLREAEEIVEFLGVK